MKIQNRMSIFEIEKKIHLYKSHNLELKISPDNACKRYGLGYDYVFLTMALDPHLQISYLYPKMQMFCALFPSFTLYKKKSGIFIYFASNIQLGSEP